MKIFPFIVINKSDMSKLSHCYDASMAASEAFNFNKPFNPDNWIILKDEKKIIDLSAMKTIGGDAISRFQALKKLLTNQ